MQCLICSSPLSGRQSKFCSPACATKGQHNACYSNQQTRGNARKEKLVELHGGKCKLCNYDKCLHALTFHHRIPADKSFNMDLRSCSNRSWESLVTEAEKCDLLCFNCHMELHYS